jgi:hypothetical protein
MTFQLNRPVVEGLAATYQVVEASRIGDLTNLVIEQINQGWRPVGGVSISNYELIESRTYLQAMTRIEATPLHQ